MNRLIALLFLAIAIAALTTDDSHAQNYRPTQPTQPFQPSQQPYGQPQKPHPTTKPAARKRPKRVGFETEAGDPFGRETATKRTCFQPPCFDPSSGCASPRKWKTIFYLVPILNGQKGRFIGFECK